METTKIASDIRKHTAQWAIRANGGYLAQACGSAEILSTLLNEILDLGESKGSFMPEEFAGIKF